MSPYCAHLGAHLGHKRFVARPALAAGDGPSMVYRRWARQFYEDLPSTAPFASSAATVRVPDGNRVSKPVRGTT